MKTTKMVLPAMMLGVALCVPLAMAQAPQALVPAPQGTSDQDTRVGSNANVDMFFGDWHTAKARTSGAVSERDVFTQGDALKPTTKAAVLRHVESYVYVSIAANGGVPAKTLSGKQQVYFFLSGAGTLTAGGDAIPVTSTTAVLIPANLSFSLKNTGSAPLTAYVITEPTPAGFQPKSKAVAKDVSTLPITTTQQEWSEIVKPIFTTEDGLATMTHVDTVTLDALTITRPFVGKSHDREDLWMDLSGTGIVFIGAFLRRQTPGMAYEHPPDNLAPTSNVNYSEDSQVKYLLVSSGK